jgi:hypothetical protein
MVGDLPCGPRADARRFKEPTSFKDLRDLRSPVHVEEEVGAGLGRSEILLRKVPRLER